MITKGERTELRSIVRQQFRVLRSEVGQRQAELIAALEDEIVDKHRESDTRWEFVAHEFNEAGLEANRRANDALKGYYGTRIGERAYFYASPPERAESRERLIERRAAIAAVEARVRGALMRLERQEADILRNLAVGALESEEARNFLGAIPSVGELVPAARLAELLEGGMS